MNALYYEKTFNPNFFEKMVYKLHLSREQFVKTRLINVMFSTFLGKNDRWF